jgi:hypothetical protein
MLGKTRRFALFGINFSALSPIPCLQLPRTCLLGSLSLILRGATAGYQYVMVLAVLVHPYETSLGELRRRHEPRRRLWMVSTTYPARINSSQWRRNEVWPGRSAEAVINVFPAHRKDFQGIKALPSSFNPFSPQTLNIYRSDIYQSLQLRPKMHSKTLLLFSVALGVALSQDFDVDDYPAQCNNSCGPIATASNTCDEQNDDDDPAQLNCICNTRNMDSLLPDCLTCLFPFRNTDDYNDDYEGNLRSINTSHR